MNKQVVKYIVISLSISFLIILSLQAYWIINSYNLKENEFDRAVIEALGNVSERLETDEAVNTFAMTLSDSAISNSGRAHKQIIISSGGNSQDCSKIGNDLNEAMEVLKHIDDTINMALSKMASELNFDIDISNENGQARFKMSNNSFSISSSFSDSTDKKDISKSISAAKIMKRSDWVSKFVSKILLEPGLTGKGMDSRISKENLQELIDYELSNKGVKIPCEFSVINDGENYNTLSSKGYKDFMAESKYQVNLFQKDLVRRTDKLVVDFPGKGKFIMGSISAILIVQLLFAMILSGVFAWTIVVIMRQKRIAEMKSDFINNMTHEFKTPIATISLALDSINNPKVLENKELLLNFTKIIKEENVKMNSHVENILQMAQIERNNISFNMSKLNLADLVSSTIESVKIQVESRGGTIAFENSAENLEIEGDSKYLVGAISNILDNANKYSPENPNIKVQLKSNSREIEVIISDNGIGISESDKQKIFEKFYRVSTGNIHTVKGFGLGLSFTRFVISAHRGEIFVEDNNPRGTVFKIKLPLLFSIV